MESNSGRALLLSESLYRKAKEILEEKSQSPVTKFKSKISSD